MGSPTALVTGCTGTIGRRVVLQLAEQDYAVVPLIQTWRPDAL